jgi:hypothetical protein
MLCLLAVGLVAGCGQPAGEPFIATRPAEAQRVELDWREGYPDGPKRLLFAVDALEITARGWAVDVAVTNESGIPFQAPLREADLSYGVMLFRTSDLDELEAAAAQNTLPPVREATTITPMPPPVLEPGETWRARLAGRGALADGAYLRVSFGPLRAAAEPPAGMEQVVVWITDRSHRL